MNRAVVISALGTVGAHGCGRAGLAAALAAGRSPAASEVDRAAGYHRPRGARLALLTPLAELAAWVPPAEARRMSLPSRMAVAAMRLALADAGLAAADLAGPQTAVVMATAFGPSTFSEALLRQILLDGPEAASPFLFTESVANAPAAQMALACQARGASITLCQREAGALLAVGRGAAEVAAGRAERALVGAVDDVSPLVHALLDRFGGLARGSAGRRPGGGGDVPAEEAGRPFDRRRRGVMAADGATVLLVESAAAAARRGARPLARIVAWGSAFDPSAPAAGWGTGHAGLARSLCRLLARAAAAGGDGGMDAAAAPAAAVDRVVSGAAGSRGGDRLEARVLRAAWDAAPLPPVLAPKGVTGEYGGGLLAALTLAAAGFGMGPTAGFASPDPQLAVVPHDGSPLPPPALVLGSSLAVGGAAAWLLLGRA